MLEVKIRLFGAFRKYGNGSEIELKVPPLSPLSVVRNVLVAHLLHLDPDFSDVDLVNDSAFALENEILQGESKIEQACSLAILPPVCGG